MLNKIISQYQFLIRKRQLIPPLFGRNTPSFHPGALTQDVVTLSRATKPHFGEAIPNVNKQRAMQASRTGKLGILQALHTQYGIKLVQIKDETGKTIWHHAAEGQHIQILEDLFQVYGSNFASDNLKIGTRLINSDNIAKRAAVLAPSNVILLLGSKAYLYLNPILNIDEKDNNGQTALHLASAKGKLRAVKFLLKIGADPNCRDNQNRTTRELAIQKGRFAVSRLIQRAQLAKIEKEKNEQKKRELIQISAMEDRKEEEQREKIQSRKRTNRLAHHLGNARRVIKWQYRNMQRVKQKLQITQTQLTQEKQLNRRKDKQIQDLDNIRTRLITQQDQQALQLQGQLTSQQNEFARQLDQTRQEDQQKFERLNATLRKLERRLLKNGLSIDNDSSDEDSVNFKMERGRFLNKENGLFKKHKRENTSPRRDLTWKVQEQLGDLDITAEGSHSSSLSSSSTLVNSTPTESPMVELMIKYEKLENRLRAEIKSLTELLEKQRKQSEQRLAQNTEEAQQILNNTLTQYLDMEKRLRKQIGILRRELNRQQKMSTNSINPFASGNI